MDEHQKDVTFLITQIGSQGGAETCLTELATGLTRRGWRVRVITMRRPRDRRKVEVLEGAGIVVESLAMESLASAAAGAVRLVRLLRAWRPYVLHTHMVHANLLGRLVRPLTRIPVLVSAARNTYEGPRWRTWAYRATDRWADATVQVSRLGAERSVATGAVPPSKIRLIHNGVDTRRFAPDPEARDRMRAALGAGDDFVWISAGRLAPLKDYPNALEAFRLLIESQPGAVYWIVGEGESEGTLRRLVAEKGIARSVHFLGHQTDVKSLMGAADGYLMSSAWEGMPNALLEACAVGLPSVATAVGGNPEIVVDEQTGFVVPPRDPAALAHAMEKLMALTESDRSRMGEAARSYVSEHFSIETMIDRWAELYAHLCGSTEA